MPLHFGPSRNARNVVAPLAGARRLAACFRKCKKCSGTPCGCQAHGCGCQADCCTFQEMLLRNSSSSKLADQGVELRCLLILELLSGFVQYTSFDLRIYTLENIAGIRWSEYIFTTPDGYYRHL